MCAAPANFSLAARAELPNAPSLPQIPGTLPAQLLERRPDIAGAERRALRPNAQTVLRSSVLSDTIRWPRAAAGALRAGPISYRCPIASVGWHRNWQATLFDGGDPPRSDGRGTRRFEQTAGAYQADGLAALQEVEDNLVALRVLARRRKCSSTRMRAARESLISPPTSTRGHGELPQCDHRAGGASIPRNAPTSIFAAGN